MNKCFIVFLLSLAPVIGRAQELYFPPADPDTWEMLAPTTLGYCSPQVDSLYAFLDQNNSKAFILLKDGKIVLERYFGTFTQDSLWYWASAGKTLIGTLVGIAQQENYLSIDDPTSQYLGPGWTSCTPEQEERITIRHQLSMTCGLDDGVANPECTDASCFTFLSDPGTRWAYHNGAFTVLERVLAAATGQGLNRFMSAALKNPVGMDGGFTLSPDNVAYFSTARSMARFGLLLLAGGTWDNRPVLSDSQYFFEMTNSSQSLNPAYGYLTWLNGKSHYMTPGRQTVFPGYVNADAPQDMFAALGKNGQLINVAPSQNMVWIRMGDPPASGGGLVTHAFNNEIWVRINELDCMSSGIEQTGKQRASAISVYPNPAHERITVRATENDLIESIEVVDLVGRCVLREYGVNEVSLRHLREGVYFVKVTSAYSETMERLIIQ